jgi:hypothetical protein
MLWKCQADNPLETKDTNTQGAPESLFLNFVPDLTYRKHQYIHIPKIKIPLFHSSQGSNALTFVLSN